MYHTPYIHTHLPYHTPYSSQQLLPHRDDDLYSDPSHQHPRPPNLLFRLAQSLTTTYIGYRSAESGTFSCQCGLKMFTTAMNCCAAICDVFSADRLSNGGSFGMACFLIWLTFGFVMDCILFTMFSFVVFCFCWCQWHQHCRSTHVDEDAHRPEQVELLNKDWADEERAYYDTSLAASRPSYPTTTDFERCARRAQREVEQAPPQPPPSVPPHSGDYYRIFHVDRISQVQHGATLTLHFTPDFDGRGYKLSGHDIDGHTVIEDGHVNYDGTAWWRERTVTKDVKSIVLSRGKFDFVKREFYGTWLESSMKQAAYITFAAVEPPPAAAATTWTVAPSQDSGMCDSREVPVATVVQVLDGDDGSGMPKDF